MSAGWQRAGVCGLCACMGARGVGSLLVEVLGMERNVIVDE